MNTITPTPHILIIRLSAFGDIISCLPIMQAIRERHPKSEINLLTLPIFAKLLEGCPFFDRIETIKRWPAHNITAWWGLSRFLRQFDIVYDLQSNDRTLIFSYLAPISLRKSWFGRKNHTYMSLTHGLAGTSIPALWDTDFSWMTANIARYNLIKPYALLVSGCAPQHPYKRWPAEKFASVAKELIKMGVRPVLVGAEAEKAEMDFIELHAPGTLNLCGQTSFFEMAEIARGAAFAIGNDTGPMHLVSAVGCPVISLFSGRTQPSQSAPRGKIVHTFQAEPIENIGIDAVIATVRTLLEPC